MSLSCARPWRGAWFQSASPTSTVSFHHSLLPVAETDWTELATRSFLAVRHRFQMLLAVPSHSPCFSPERHHFHLHLRYQQWPAPSLTAISMYCRFCFRTPLWAFTRAL